MPITSTVQEGDARMPLPAHSLDQHNNFTTRK